VETTTGVIGLDMVLGFGVGVWFSGHPSHDRDSQSGRKDDFGFRDSGLERPGVGKLAVRKSDSCQNLRRSWEGARPSVSATASLIVSARAVVVIGAGVGITSDPGQATAVVVSAVSASVGGVIAPAR